MYISQCKDENDNIIRNESVTIVSEELLHYNIIQYTHNIDKEVNNIYCKHY